MRQKKHVNIFSRGMRTGMLVLAAAGCATEPTPNTAASAPPKTPPATSAASTPASDRQATTPAQSSPRALGVAQAQALGAALGSLSSHTIDEAVTGYYAAHDNAAAWFDNHGRARSTIIKALLDALSRADRQGLVIADYGYDALAQRIEQADAGPGPLDPTALAALDIRLSQAFVGYAVDLHRGRAEGEELRPRWYEDLPAADYAGALERATRAGDVDAALAELRPPHDGYTLLVKALADYRAIVDAGGWPRLPDGPLLETGMTDPRVPALRERLQASGDLPPAAGAADSVQDGVEALEKREAPDATAGDTRSRRYDAPLAAAVEHFQRRHGLKVDGKVGSGTRAALNVAASDRVRRIEINLERWRWLPPDLGERYIMVNIPEYRLRAYEDGTPQLEMRVVVGKSYNDRATPVFSDRLEYVVFRPYWNVPPGIAAEEIVPKARKNSDYLDERNYEIVARFDPDIEALPATAAHIDKVEAGELYVRQRAGRHNALGLVKFIFPNVYAVYLHDSPAERLFSRAERDFSHGCVRVQYPAELAAFVLSLQPTWDPTRIDAALHEEGRQQVALGESIPVYLVYWTAFANESGVNFRPDLYENDPRVEAAMRRADSSQTEAAAQSSEAG